MGCKTYIMEKKVTTQQSRIEQGRCEQVMAAWPAESVNFILTDPPYLVNYRDRNGRSLPGDRSADWLAPAFAQMFRVLEPNAFCVSFYGWTKTDLFFAAWKRVGFRVAGHITFPKRYTSRVGFLRYQHESAYLLTKGRPAEPPRPVGDVLDWLYTGNLLHPTQKPLGILIPLIEAFSRAGAVVADPFAGSGSTCLAAKLLGRIYWGVELDPANHATAIARVARYGLTSPEGVTL